MRGSLSGSAAESHQWVGQLPEGAEGVMQLNDFDIDTGQDQQRARFYSDFNQNL